MPTVTPRKASIVIVLAVAVVSLGLLTGAASAHGGDDGLHHHDGFMGTHDGMGWGLGLLWLVLGAVVVGLTLGALLLATRRDGGGEDTALTRLRERYASGEIDDEEFERRRQILRD